MAGQNGIRARRRWRNLHLGVDADTHEIAAAGRRPSCDSPKRLRLQAEGAKPANLARQLGIARSSIYRGRTVAGSIESLLSTCQGRRRYCRGYRHHRPRWRGGLRRRRRPVHGSPLRPCAPPASAPVLFPAPGFLSVGRSLLDVVPACPVRSAAPIPLSVWARPRSPAPVPPMLPPPAPAPPSIPPACRSPRRHLQRSGSRRSSISAEARAPISAWVVSFYWAGLAGRFRPLRARTDSA